jgi:hypothetical protein
MGSERARYRGRPESGTKRSPTTPHSGAPRSLPDWARVLQRDAGNHAVAGLLHNRRSGTPVDPATRWMMETRLGHDFGDVRVHSDAAAAQSADQVQAEAFTIGEDVVLGATAPPAHTPRGQWLLAHELTHVVQQRRGGSPPSLDPASAPEQAADVVASAVTSGQTPAPISAGTAVGVARQPMDPRHARGHAGEQGMGFEFYPQSEGWIFFDGPSGSAGHGVTSPGFDGVAYNTRTGELHLVDNKSLKATGNVQSATAIDPTRNLPKNVDALIARIEATPHDVPGRVRMLGLLRRTKAALAANQPLPEGVKLVVTGVGGRSSGVSRRLTALGVEFRAQDAPVPVSAAKAGPAEPPVAASAPAKAAPVGRPSTTPVTTEAGRAPKPTRTTFETEGRVTYEVGAPSRAPAVYDPYAAPAAKIGEGLAAIIPDAMQALQDKTIQNAVAHRMKDQWPSVERMRREFPNDYIAAAVSLMEWEHPDPAGMVARMVNYVTFVHGASKEKCLATLTASQRQMPDAGWVEVGPFIGFIPPSMSLEDAYSQVTSHSGCFIATACYGSTDAPAVILLRRFRDRVLCRNAVGRALVDRYYRWSPPVARSIASRPRLRRAVRIVVVEPAVLVARATLSRTGSGN